MTLKRKRSDRFSAGASASSCQKCARCTDPSLESPLPTPPPAFSPSPASRIFLLTEENLREHTKSLSPRSEAMPKPGSSSPKRALSPARLDKRTKLWTYNVNVDSVKDYPEELKLHIENTLLRKRETQPSPNAKKIASKRQMAAAQDEDGGIDLLKPYLLFVGEDKDDENGIPGIVSRDKINLASEFLPPVPNGDVLIAQGGQLSRPQPDIAIGYTPSQFARKAGVNLVTKFTKEEDVWLTNYRLTTFMHFPFLTSQWKPAAGSETFHHAENQAARDGSTIVNHLHDLFYEAYDRKPTAVEASHVSVTCDMQAVQVWIHWREETAEEGVQHYMRSFARAFLCDVSQLQEVRSVLWNVLEYSMGPRLSIIKAALPLWWKNSGSKGQTRRASVSAPSVASSSVSNATLPRSLQFQVPLTPSSISGDSEPQKKRQRTMEDYEEVVDRGSYLARPHNETIECYL